MTHQPTTFGTRESAVNHPMPGPTEELIEEGERVKKHLVEIRAKCHHHFVPTGTPQEMGFVETLVPGVWDLTCRSNHSATFMCSECATPTEIQAGEGGQCPCCGARLGYTWMQPTELGQYFNDTEFDFYDSPAIFECPSCDFKGVSMLYNR